jgi:hypothetical protein
MSMFGFSAPGMHQHLYRVVVQMLLRKFHALVLSVFYMHVNMNQASYTVTCAAGVQNASGDVAQLLRSSCTLFDLDCHAFVNSYAWHHNHFLRQH